MRATVENSFRRYPAATTIGVTLMGLYVPKALAASGAVYVACQLPDIIDVLEEKFGFWQYCSTPIQTIFEGHVIPPTFPEVHAELEAEGITVTTRRRKSRFT
jgi:hypothetical protein